MSGTIISGFCEIVAFPESSTTGSHCPSKTTTTTMAGSDDNEPTDNSRAGHGTDDDEEEEEFPQDPGRSVGRAGDDEEEDEQPPGSGDDDDPDDDDDEDDDDDDELPRDPGRSGGRTGEDEEEDEQPPGPGHDDNPDDDDDEDEDEDDDEDDDDDDDDDEDEEQSPGAAETTGGTLDAMDVDQETDSRPADSSGAPSSNPRATAPDDQDEAVASIPDLRLSQGCQSLKKESDVLVALLKKNKDEIANYVERERQHQQGKYVGPPTKNDIKYLGDVYTLPYKDFYFNRMLELFEQKIRLMAEITKYCSKLKALNNLVLGPDDEGISIDGELKRFFESDDSIFTRQLRKSLVHADFDHLQVTFRNAPNVASFLERESSYGWVPSTSFMVSGKIWYIVIYIEGISLF